MLSLKKNKGDLIKLIEDLRAQGLSDRDVVEDLRDRGYKNQEILDSLKKADMKSASGGPKELEPAFEDEEEDAELPSLHGTNGDTEEFEELAEKIIADKWKDVSKELDDIKKWKDTTEDAIDEIRTKVKEIGDSMERLKSSVAEKVSAYASGLEDVSTDIKAMDKVFKQILPEFTSNVKQLTELVDKLKGKKK